MKFESRRLDSLGLKIENLKFRVSSFTKSNEELFEVVKELLKALKEDLSKEEKKDGTTIVQTSKSSTRSGQSVKTKSTKTSGRTREN